MSCEPIYEQYAVVSDCLFLEYVCQHKVVYRKLAFNCKVLVRDDGALFNAPLSKHISNASLKIFFLKSIFIANQNSTHNNWPRKLQTSRFEYQCLNPF